MITEDYVSFEIAKLLKEKGFNEMTELAYGLEHGHIRSDLPVSYWRNSEIGKYKFSCPTLQMTMKWLRKVHNIDIIAPPQYDNIKWTYSAIIFKLSIPCTEIRLNDNKDKKEAAYEVAIKYCLEHLI